MQEDIDRLKMKLIRAIVKTEDRAVLHAALKVLQLGQTDEASAMPFDTPPESNPAPDVLPGGTPPTGDAKGLQDDIDEVFNPK